MREVEGGEGGEGERRAEGGGREVLKPLLGHLEGGRN